MFKRLVKFAKIYKRFNSPKSFDALNIFSFKNKIYLLGKNLNKLETIDLNSKEKKELSCPFFGKTKNWKNLKISNSTKNQLNLSVTTGPLWNKKNHNYSSSDLINWHKTSFNKNIFESIYFIKEYTNNKDKIAYFNNNSEIFYWRIKNDLIEERKRETDLNFKKTTREKIDIASSFSKKGFIFLFYYVYDYNKKISLKLAIMNEDNPSEMLYSKKNPVFQLNFSDYPLGIIETKEGYEFYWKNKKGEIYSIYFSSKEYEYTLNQCYKIQKNEKASQKDIALNKNKKNPIIEPRENISWETNGTFNPAAIYLDNKVHLIYRAIGRDNMSVFGHAVSKDGINFLNRNKKPVYTPKQSFEFTKQNEQKPSLRYPYMSGGGWGGWGGCEDPRLSAIDDRIFMTYTAFNGKDAPGVAITSIKKDDFLNRKWNWDKAHLISEPGKIQKNWSVFPEKINNKYAIIHSISPDILIDYFDELDSEKVIIKSHYSKEANNLKWESYLRGVASPPIKTAKGWILFYHAMDRKNPDLYKAGVMLLDLDDPTKIIGRSSKPILEPCEFYENNGKFGVIYICGSILKNDNVYIYYGGADKVSCVATVKLDDILECLLPEKKQKIKKILIK